MHEMVAILVSGLVLIGVCVGAALYADTSQNDLRTERFKTCITAIQNPAECALASK